ncbi:MAG: hypothetical protein CNLJKLNK_00696 [Holosporales bacterium]
MIKNAINQYNSIKNYVNQFEKNARNVLPNTTSKGESFSQILDQITDNFQTDVKNLETSMKDLALGNISPEEIAPQVKAISLEAEGGIAITKASVESLKKILDIQV